jgi:hypothetical protein
METNLNPHISVDCVVFGFDHSTLKVLLVEQSPDDNGKNKLKLPGDLIKNDEDLDHAALRVLNELTGLNQVFLKQFKVFDSPDRIHNPKDIKWLEKSKNMSIDRVITIAYYALVSLDTFDQISQHAHWKSLDDTGILAFDHKMILDAALETVQEQIKSEPLAFELLPEKFTLRNLQNVYEVIYNTQLDNRNFRKKIKSLGYIKPLKEKEKGVAHKPAQFYTFDRAKYLQSKHDHSIIIT